MICEKCGAELSEGSLYCEKCGASAEPDVIWDSRSIREERTVCPYCGRDVQADDLYCGFCGRKLADAEPKAKQEQASDRMEESGVQPESRFDEREENGAGPEVKTEQTAEMQEQPERAAAQGKLETEPEQPSGGTEESGTEPEQASDETEESGTELESPSDETEDSRFEAEPETAEMPVKVEIPETKTVTEDACAELAAASNRADINPSFAEEPEKYEKEPETAADTAPDEEPEAFAAQEAPERAKRFSYLTPVAAGLVFLLALTAFLRLFTGRRPEEAAQTKVIYYHEDALYLADLMTENTPEEITDSCLDVGVPPYEGLIDGDLISVNGKWLFWREEFDGETFDLYRMNLDGDSAKEKLAANVSSYQAAEDGTVLFERGGSLYYYGREAVRLGRDILFWQADPEGKLVCWEEKNGETGNVCYFQNMADGSEKVELDKNVTDFYASDSLSRFMSLKGGVLYLLDASGAKERIAQNVVSVESCDLEEERIYYMTENPVRLAYTDVVSDDEGAMTEDDWLYVSDLGQFEVPYRQLRYHWPEGDSEVSGRCFLSGRDSGPCISGDGAYCIYREGPRIEDLKADWTEFKDRLEDEAFGMRLLEKLDGDGWFSGLRLAAEGRTVNEYEDVRLPGGSGDVCYDEENQNLYLYMVSDGGRQGTLYKIPLTGGDAGEPAAVDGGLDGIGEMTAADDGVYYIKNPGTYGGDLYFNGQEIAYDVAGFWMAGQELAYIYDYDSSSVGGADFSLALYKDGEMLVAGKEIACADCAPDGTAVMLADFDPLKGEGQLLYFDGKDTRVLAEQVTGFVPRNKSARIQ